MQEKWSQEKKICWEGIFCLDSFGKLPSEGRSKMAEHLDLGLRN